MCIRCCTRHCFFKLGQTRCCMCHVDAWLHEVALPTCRSPHCCMWAVLRQRCIRQTQVSAAAVHCCTWLLSETQMVFCRCMT